MLASVARFGAKLASGRRERLFYSLAVAGIILLCGLARPLLSIVLHGQSSITIFSIEQWAPYYYNTTFLAANYFDMGFIRRGLAGSIAHILSSDPNAGAFRFHLVSLFALFVPVLVVQLRMLKTVALPAALFTSSFLLLSPQTFLAWSTDIGRTDLLVEAFVVAAAWAFFRNKLALATCLLLFGSLIHENTVIFGGPLIAGLALCRQERTRSDLIRWATALVLLFAGLVLLAGLQSLFAPPTSEFARALTRATPLPASEALAELRDCAVYMMVGGLRSLRTAICYNFYAETHWLRVAASLGTVTMSALALGLDRRPFAFALAVLVPLIFLHVVANDAGRWTMAATVNAWFLSSALQIDGRIVLSRARILLGCAILALLLAMGVTRDNEISWATEAMGRRLGFPAMPSVGEWMTHCDPDWRALIE